MKIKKTYYFAFWTSLYFSVFTFAILFLTAYFFLDQWINPLYFLLYLSVVFVFTFFIIQYRLEKFIYLRLKKIYDDVSMLDSSDFNKTEITSDIETLSREVQKFVPPCLSLQAPALQTPMVFLTPGVHHFWTSVCARPFQGTHQFRRQ